MGNYLTIEQASSSHLKDVEELLELTELPIDGVSLHIDDFFVAKTEGYQKNISSIVGCVGLEIYGEDAVLRSLAVHPEYQGKGIGKTLILKITEYAKKKSVKMLYLLTTTAEDYFPVHGFQFTSRDDIPQTILNSPEFSSICPSSAISLSKSVE
jgi:amino-acid N-acetyltransferase